MKWAISQFNLEALHKWDKAFDEVKYLNNWHRHLFAIKVYVEVNHDDRDVEFINLGHSVIKLLNETLPKHHYGDKEYLCVGSCEMLAERVQKLVLQAYPYRKIKVEVFEDGINGPGGALVE